MLQNLKKKKKKFSMHPLNSGVQKINKLKKLYKYIYLYMYISRTHPEIAAVLEGPANTGRLDSPINHMLAEKEVA